MVLISKPLAQKLFENRLSSQKERANLSALSSACPRSRICLLLVCSAFHVRSKAILTEHIRTGLGTHFFHIHALPTMSTWVPN